MCGKQFSNLSGGKLVRSLALLVLCLCSFVFSLLLFPFSFFFVVAATAGVVFIVVLLVVLCSLELLLLILLLKVVLLETFFVTNYLGSISAVPSGPVSEGATFPNSG